MRNRLLIFLVLFSALLVGTTSVAGALSLKEKKSLSAEFGAAAKEYKVPKKLLMAIGYVNTRWEMPPPQPYQKGNPEAQGNYGIMSLTKNPSKNTLDKAARLTGISEKKLETNRAANIRGAAALLAAAEGKKKPSSLEGWYSAVARVWGGSVYANQVFDTLRKGASERISSGERITLASQGGAQPRQLYSPMASGGADYSRAIWTPASSANYTSANRPYSGPINKIVIHVTESSYASALNWFQNPNAQASVQYVVRSSDGQITQMVHNKDIAWHSGNWPYNQTSIGIEHEGYTSNPAWFTDAMYRSSAQLVAYLCNKYHIPIDRQHIIGHNEVPDPNHPGEYGGVDHHTDPGPYWNWSKYMGYVRY